MRRLAIFLFFDADGHVDRYVPYALTRLREQIDSIVVVVNGPLEPDSRVALEAVADDVVMRRNVGYDVGAYQEALRHVGWQNLAEYDEIHLLNYTFFGPIGSFGPMFDRMDALDVDFWGVTEHGEARPNPFVGARDPDVLPRHLQSTWLVVRRSMHTSAAFRDYWETMPLITSYDDSVLKHEARFTEHFAALGYRWVAAFSQEDFNSDNAALDYSDLLVEAGCPLVKRRVFFMESGHLERHAILARRTLERLEASDYPMDMFWENLVRTTRPRTLMTNASLLEVLSDKVVSLPDPPPRVVVVIHLYYEDMVDELWGYVRNVPAPFDLVVTTDTAVKRDRLEARLRELHTGGLDVRVASTNAGRDVSAFFVDCADVLSGGQYDLVCKIHSKKSPQDGHNVSTAFKEYLLDSLLGSPGLVSQVLELFARQPTLGAVFPPVVTIGYPTLGHAWFRNLAGVKRLRADLGIGTPLDTNTPVAPLGSMYWARPEALRLLVGRTWSPLDFDGQVYEDGGFTHVVERSVGYAVSGAGYHLREVLDQRWAATAYKFLEYRLQRLASLLPAESSAQYPYLGAALAAANNPLVAIKRSVGQRRRLAKTLSLPYRGTRAVYRAVRPRPQVPKP